MNITVYCGSSFGNDPAYREAAVEIGNLIAENGHTLIYGGSGIGLMGVLADTVIAGGSPVIGVEPRFFLEQGLLHEGITKTIPTDTMAERKVIMMEMGDAYIALPGGAGTLDEISEVIVLNQLDRHDKPAIFYNKNHYYDAMKAVYEQMVSAGFLARESFERIHFASSAEEILALLC